MFRFYKPPMSDEIKFTTLEGAPLELVLYKSDSCFFCHRVFGKMAELGMEIPCRDVWSDPDARGELMDKGGSAQVPCLLINGIPLYESADIMEFLETKVRSSGQ